MVNFLLRKIFRAMKQFHLLKLLHLDLHGQFSKIPLDNSFCTDPHPNIDFPTRTKETFTKPHFIPVRRYGFLLLCIFMQFIRQFFSALI